MSRSAVVAVLGVVVGIALLLLVLVASTYNRLVQLDQEVQASWAQVENVYQRRADLIPNLVATVKGAAEFERDTFVAVTEARSEVGRITAEGMDAVLRDPDAFARFQQAQRELSSALSRLIAVSEAYPELKATEAFRDLQIQLEGTENRIAVERMRFNDAARAFNVARQRFPAVWVAGLFGARFQDKPYFTAEAGAWRAPEVNF